MIKKEHIIHLVLWSIPCIYILFISENFIIGVFSKRENTLLVPFIYGTLFNMLLFYINIRIINKSFESNGFRNKWILFAIIVLVSINFLETFIDYQFINLREPIKNGLFGDIFIGNLVIHIVFFGLAIAYVFTFKAINNEKQKNILMQEKLTTELSFLKSQINPHFLFNTLNNLFSLARKNNDEETANGITQLSKMMRYMLYEGDIDKIPLNKEIEYIENYIYLQKLRFHSDDEIEIKMEVLGNTESFLICPLVLIPFVENAFKHGVRIQNPSKIDINIKVVDASLIFEIQNTQHEYTGFKEKYSGFGMENVQNRLDLLYKNSYELIVNDDKSCFQVILKIESR